MKNCEFSKFEEANKDSGIENSELLRVYASWLETAEFGEKLLLNLENEVLKELKDDPYLNIFPATIGLFEKIFFKTEARNSPIYGHISPILVMFYDLILSLKNGYSGRSIVSCASTLRMLFELRVILSEIVKNPSVNSNQYYRFKEVEVLLYEFRNKKIDINCFRERARRFPEWYDDNLKKMENKMKSWTAIEKDSLFSMANRNNLGKDYNHIYSTTSKFVHIKSIAENYYRASGFSPIARVENLRPLVALGFNQVKETFLILCKLLNFPIAESEESLGVSFVLLMNLD